jgi:hypothetical protein
MPRSAARNAAAYPPGPPPMTAMLRFEEFVMSLFVLETCHANKSFTAETQRTQRKTNAKGILGDLCVSAVKIIYP